MVDFIPGEVDWAWAAGLFEGEGSFLFVRQSKPNKSGVRRAYLGMKLTMTDEDVVRKFHSIVQIGRVNGPYKNPGAKDHWKPHWRWDVNGRRALEIALNPLFTAHLGERRLARLNEILRDVISQEPLHKDPDALLCNKGHPFTKENTRITTNKKGHRIRQCIACRRESGRRSYYAHQQARQEYSREWQRKRRIRERELQEQRGVRG